MIINDIPYVSLSPKVGVSMAACISMVVSFFKSPVEPEHVYNIFGNTIMSNSFREDYSHLLDGCGYNESLMTACGEYILRRYFSGVSADVIKTDLKNVKMSYVKRRLPLILTGRFPLAGGETPNSIVIIGFVDDYIIAHDPRGNAMTGYRDRYGANVLYPSKELLSWVGKGEKISALRILGRSEII